MKNTFFFNILHNLLKFKENNFIYFFVFLTILYTPITAQSPKKFFKLSRTYQDRGDFIKAEKCLSSILEKKESINAKNLVAVYNQLGIINNSLGRYNKAIAYYLEAEEISMDNIGVLRYKLPSIYNNLAIIFKSKGDYKKALDYYSESINYLNIQELSVKEKIISIEHAYNNMGIVYYLKKKYPVAIDYFQKSIKITKKNKLEGLDVSYNNYANCLRETNDYLQAEKYYKKCISLRIKKYGKDYYKLSTVYKEYGKLKIKTGEYQQALYLYRKALEIYKTNFGEKHPFIAEMYTELGNFYMETKDYPLALENYQQSLLANSSNFNELDVFKNPNPEHVFSKIQLLLSLKKKAGALVSSVDYLNTKTEKVKRLKLSLQTLKLGINVLQNVRMNYLSTESKLYITKNGKEFYMAAIESSILLYELTGNKKYIKYAYSFSRSGKAAVLLNGIKQNRVLVQILPDSLKQRKDKIGQNISALKKLIFDEYGKMDANQQKISYWKSALFQLNQNYEKIIKTIKKKYPVYPALLAKTKIVDLATIQNKLLSDETLIEYSYSVNKNKGRLYTFVVNHDKLAYHRQTIDSSFEQGIDFLRKKIDQMNRAGLNIREYNKLNKTLYGLYRVLLEPVYPKKKNIIIVPDEKIAYLSFDALLPAYHEASEINFGGLPYLVFKYRFSYSYSTNLLFSPFKTNNSSQATSFLSGIATNLGVDKKNEFVYAFAPSYHTNYASNLRFSFGELKSARKEIKSILKYFKGKAYLGDAASKSKFKSIQNHQGIFHLAMHANKEEEHPEYSFLAFSQVVDLEKDSYLYNYEISTSSMKASMVVLSACNTGSGKIYSGEGVMSLGRGFRLAGASSVVQTLWEINDETSAEIMGSFYKYLSKGKSKSEALQLAKIDYIENSSPELTNPIYWSGIVLMGSPAPLVKTNLLSVYASIGLFFLAGLYLMFYFYRKKRMFKK